MADTTTSGMAALMHEFLMTDDDYYTVVAWHFAVCDVLMLTAPEMIPARWQFTPSPLGTEIDGYEGEMMLELIESGTVTVADLVTFGDHLAAEADRLRPAGE